ncbi:hypothetical protein RHA1_ro08899 (plasmid) [Rhodococcus jostii RHA1]|jgi:hypothetical protein|uniref:Uncharacterized protein n=1 Tax=Rhodococcus jostii (strain RHA1) TaxID=101510 RepID=Q0RXP3_RHOJR|nr:hypothetical protein RHA1_ro08899 [Rhodococcus jostii RHA1]
MSSQCPGGHLGELRPIPNNRSRRRAVHRSHSARRTDCCHEQRTTGLLPTVDVARATAGGGCCKGPGIDGDSRRFAVPRIGDRLTRPSDCGSAARQAAHQRETRFLIGACRSLPGRIANSCPETQAADQSHAWKRVCGHSCLARAVSLSRQRRPSRPCRSLLRGRARAA